MVKSKQQKRKSKYGLGVRIGAVVLIVIMVLPTILSGILG